VNMEAMCGKLGWPDTVFFCQIEAHAHNALGVLLCETTFLATNCSAHPCGHPQLLQPTAVVYTFAIAVPSNGSTDCCMTSDVHL